MESGILVCHVIDCCRCLLQLRCVSSQAKVDRIEAPNSISEHIYFIHELK